MEKNEKHQIKNTKELNNLKDQQNELLNKKCLEQTHLIENLSNAVQELKEENKNFSHIMEEINLEKENLKNQNTILKSLVSSSNPQMKFSNNLQEENYENSKKKKESSKNRLFNEMLNVVKKEFRKLNTLNYNDYDNYFEIIEQEYDILDKRNMELRTKQQEFLDFFSKIQEAIDVK